MKSASVFMKRLAGLAAAVSLMVAYSVEAVPYFEVGDAGTTADTANSIFWDTDTIFGGIHADDGGGRLWF